MKKRVYRVRTQYIFEGVFEMVAESREDARQKVIQNCGLVMGGNIHSTLPDEEVNWAFSTHPEVRTEDDISPSSWRTKTLCVQGRLTNSK